MPALSRQETEKLAKDSGDWMLSSENISLTKRFDLGSFNAALEFFNEIGRLALEQKIFPDLNLREHIVEVKLDAAGPSLSRSDFSLAEKINRLF